MEKTLPDQSNVLEISFAQGWSILQDVHDLGERLEIFSPDFPSTAVGHQISEWEPLERLGHLQPILSSTPYYGRELRYFNEAPWWYRRNFLLDNPTALSILRFEGVDYFAKVWVNGDFVGEHEGYGTPFEFEVGQWLKSGENVLVVKVWAPWDQVVFHDNYSARTFAVQRDMMKGTYEHDDTFVARDVNPVGIWGDVSLTLHPGVRLVEKIDLTLPKSIIEGSPVEVVLNAAIESKEPQTQSELVVKIREVATQRIIGVEKIQQNSLMQGRNEISVPITIAQPKLWEPWDRGEQNLYSATVEVLNKDGLLDRQTISFGLRTVRMVRTQSETTFYVNEKRMFLRGTTYFPDVYVSEMNESRYRRDLQAIKVAGFNAIRIHVHTERSIFYDLCDEYGFVVIQDSDFNWVHPSTEAWAQRAGCILSDMIEHLKNHPSIICWILLNEPHRDGNDFENGQPGPHFIEIANFLDESRPTILGSWSEQDVRSGDSHNYAGSLTGEDTHYLDAYKMEEKLNTEFGFDAPPIEQNLSKERRVYQRLAPMVASIPELQVYQYRLIRYYIEHYRIHRFRPTSGYFQFMFIDLCPQSFYGLYDWWGYPKAGVDPLKMSNQPVGVFMEHTDKPLAIWLVNDSQKDYQGCEVRWIVSTKDEIIMEGHKQISLPADTSMQVSELQFPVDPNQSYHVSLIVRDAESVKIAYNLYEDAFHHPSHPLGHPSRMSHEFGVRLFSA